ncbi:MAG: M12 family metallo-peptidase [Fimbriimonadales bacterium]|nr:M12 family metallo-peptidase [Fimbriimonadales bacterium]
MRAMVRVAGCLLLLSGVVWGCAETPPQTQTVAPRPLFQPIRPAKPPAEADRRGMLEYQPVDIRWETLYALQPGSRVELNLLRNVRLIASIERVERRGERSVSYFGKLDGVPDGYSHVILTNEGEVLLATIYSPPLEIEFGVIYHRDGYHLAYRVDPTVRGGCKTGLEPTAEPTDSELEPQDGTVPQSDFSPAGDFEPASCVQPTATVDVMVVYTPAVRAIRGTHDAVRAGAQLGVDVSNTVYQSSQIPLRARLVHVAEVSYSEGSDTFGTHLDRLRNNSDGHMDIVHTWRDQYRADDVALFVADDDGGTLCGLATCVVTAGGAFFVLDGRNNSCIGLGWPMFTHELGHNQGCAHNRAVAGSCPRYSYSYGYRFTGTDNRRYATVMAYLCNDTGCSDCTGVSSQFLIPFFSNPDVDYAGVATGRPEGDSCAADNARTVRETSRMRENIRLLDIWVQFDYSGLERGVFTQPFNTVAEGVNAITEYPTFVIPTLYIKAGSSNERPRITKRMRVEACGGTVRIGAP